MGQDKPKKREKNFHVWNRFYPTQVRELKKKFKKLKSIILASFQAKTYWDKTKRREKNFLGQNGFTRSKLENSQKH